MRYANEEDCQKGAPMIYEKEKWSLEIHHIDPGGGDSSPGDATLIIVKYEDKIARTALIDGGMQAGKSGFPVLSYLEDVLGDNGKLDVMVNTHYDKDHIQGLIGLLRCNSGDGATYDGKKAYPKKPHRCFTNTRIFDLGFNERYSSATSFNQGYPNYLKAIHGLREGFFEPKFNSIVVSKDTSKEASEACEQGDNKNRELFDVKGKGLEIDEQRQHVTQYVSDYKERDKEKFQPLDWLVGSEILWSTGTSCTTDDENAYEDGRESDAFKSGAPAIICVSANAFPISEWPINEWPLEENMRGARKSERPVPAGEEESGELTGTYDNKCSLAFIIQFNNFRYYVGGDLPTEIEDDLAEALNPENDIKKRVIAMKTSHHGASESTSKTFIEKLMPSAVIVSCGLNNLFCHPHAPTLKRLIDAKYPFEAKMDRCYLTGFHNPVRKDVTKENHFITQATATFDDPLTDKTKYKNSINIFINKYYKPVEVAGVYECRNPQGSWVTITAGEEVMSDDDTITGDVVLTVSYAQSCNDGTPTKGRSKNVFTVNCAYYFDLIEYANDKKWKDRDYARDKSFPHTI